MYRGLRQLCFMLKSFGSTLLSVVGHFLIEVRAMHVKRSSDVNQESSIYARASWFDVYQCLNAITFSYHYTTNTRVHVIVVCIIKSVC